MADGMAGAGVASEPLHSTLTFQKMSFQTAEAVSQTTFPSLLYE